MANILSKLTLLRTERDSFIAILASSRRACAAAGSHRRSFPLRGPLLFGSQASRHHLPRSIADKHLHFNHYDPSHNLLGTATLPTGAPEPTRRGEGGLLTGLRHGHHAHRYLSGIPAWQSLLLDGLWHGHHAHKYYRAIPAWRGWGASDRSLARRPCPQVLQSQPCVAKSSSDRSSARRPCPQVLLGHGRVPKGRKSVLLTG